MKAILLTRTGGPEVLDYVDVPTPKPASDQVLVKADTIGVSRPEILVRKGIYQWMPKMPAIPGIEMSGTVVEIGSDVRDIQVGQRVFVTARELSERAGCYAEYIAVPARAIFKLPDGVDMEAAACLSNYQVGYHILHLAARPVPGGTAIIDSAAGGTGSALVQLAKIAGMKVVAIVGSDEKVKAIEAFGADHAINYTTEDVVARVLALTGGHGGDLVLDGIGGKAFALKFPMIGPFGMLVSYGKLQGMPDETLVEQLGVTHYEASPAVRFFTMHTTDERPDLRAQSMNYLIERLAARAIRPLIQEIMPLKDVRRAHEMLEARGVIGKVLLKP